MSHPKTDESRLLVLVQPEHSAARTVEYGLREARDANAELETPVTVDIGVVVDTNGPVDDRGTRHQVETTVSTFEMDEELRDAVHIHSIRVDDTVSPHEAVRTQLGDHDVIRILLDSNSDIPVEPLRTTFGPTTVELAPSEEIGERRRLLHPGGGRRLATIFGLTYLFYLAIGGFVGGLDLLTGAISAAVVALSLSRVALSREPTVRRTGGRVARMLLFVPVLLWEIVKANFVIAAVILHPRLPIDPSFGTIETDTSEGLERMILANSITLTPGTVAIDVDDRTLTIHSLTSGGLADLEGGRLERLVAWVFHGTGGNDLADQSGGGGE